jgi:hypothetical protein
VRNGVGGAGSPSHGGGETGEVVFVDDFAPVHVR